MAEPNETEGGIIDQIWDWGAQDRYQDRKEEALSNWSTWSNDVVNRDEEGITQ